MRTQLALVVGVAALSMGCGLRTYSSGVMQLGPDTFTVSADDLNASTAKQAALTQAQQRCANLNKEILVTNTRAVRDPNRNIYDVTFRCLAKGDPELTRPTYTKEPDIVVEDKRK
jgi:hypothetical protein